MYKNFDKTSEYYCLDIYNKTYWKIGNKEKLIEYCFRNFDSNFSEVGMNINDTYAEVTRKSDGSLDIQYSFRKFIIFDGLNRVIDISQFKEEISNFIPKKRKWSIYSWRKRIPYLPEFRKGPVPGTGHCHHRYYCLRMIKTTQERRMNSNPEVYEYIRPARRSNNLPNLYDDIWRNYSKSWKDCTKKRKQWMK